MLCRAAVAKRLVTNPPMLACLSTRLAHTLPDLPYDYGALSPVISSEIMELHHKKHHQTYVNNFNNAEEQLKEATNKGDISKIISLAPALKFNGGGHLNHSIFWKNLSPNGGGQPSGDLLEQINKDFGSYDNFVKTMSASTIAIQGSGWGWLGYDRATSKLVVATCANQDPLQSTTGLVPLLGIDVWEHAYYLQYKNVRPDYVKAIWEIVNWKDVSERFVGAK
ncbi:superoxide dismutase [Mn], mitochondrial-like [Saccoglossus kowalevskii]|uniref:Superoxide dismutase n=1 Tax=Saccoglossus kowalevskii TaxID=10224 RepID=A0ABM0H115_SACKO|nr:PREDICTED: superoxide dismutase [Mn], mitochondrial-like [Saccoglossus kowalevskii]